MGVRRIDEYRCGASRQAFPNGYRSRPSERSIAKPVSTIKADRLSILVPIVPVGDKLVLDHGATEELEGGVLLPGR